VPDLENNEIRVERNNESWTVPEPNDDPIGNTSIALSGGTCWGCGGTGDRRYEYIKVNDIDQKQTNETAITNLKTDEIKMKQGGGFQKIDSIHKVNASDNGRFFGRHKIGVGFRGRVLAGSRAIFYKSFTPQTGGDHSVTIDFNMNRFSKIIQPELIEIQASGQNLVYVASAVTTLDGAILDHIEYIIYNRTEPEWTDALRAGVTQMVGILATTYGGVVLNLADLALTAGDITDALTTQGTVVDEEYDHTGQVDLSAKFEKETEYIIQSNIWAVSGADLNESLGPSPTLGTTLGGSFVDFGFSGGIDRVTIRNSTTDSKMGTV
jgi:hypothetical protein